MSHIIMSDIRNFFKRQKTAIVEESVQDSVPVCEEVLPSSSVEPQLEIVLDIGQYVNDASLNTKLKYTLLKSPWEPAATYDFKNDLTDHSKRPFRYAWLTQYPNWLVYSAKLKGALCRTCVLFRPKITRGVQGAFITRPFVNYKDFHESVRAHLKSQWHRESTESSWNFLNVIDNKTLSVEEQINKSVHNRCDANRKKLVPIIKSILFCGEHDAPLRGKTSDRGMLRDLLAFRVDAGDNILKEHIETAAKNAVYTSHRTQNELVSIAGKIIQRKVVNNVKLATCYAILADESADISGTEQLSIGVRYVDETENTPQLREEFLGFVPLKELNADSIANSIIHFLNECGLDKSKIVGQGYDGCSTMAGKEGGVQKIIRDKTCSTAQFFHCASHNLNLVVNDLNSVSEIRNTVGTIKEVIRFFRESVIRRKLVPNIPLLCETRWSEKYKSVRIFNKNFIQITNALTELSENGNSKTKQHSYQLLSAVSTPAFLICSQIIAKYSALLEPVSNILQGVSMDRLKVQNHVAELTNIFRMHRENAELHFKELFSKSLNTAEHLDVEIKIPRQASRQTYRDNTPALNPEEYYKRILFIPYLDSLITSLNNRFCENNRKSFALFNLHPSQIRATNRENFIDIVKLIEEHYKYDNFYEEAISWYEVWRNRPTETQKMDFIDLIYHSKQLFPSVYKAVLTGLTLPVTTCSIERSFSTLRRVKTWLRSTMTDDRLSALCLISVHREKIGANKDCFIEDIIQEFSLSPRRLQFAFSTNEDSD